jgi:uncharacterized protein
LGITPLIHASASGRVEVVKLLLQKGADVNAKTRDGETALKVVQKTGTKEIVEMLQTYGARE